MHFHYYFQHGLAWFARVIHLDSPMNRHVGGKFLYPASWFATGGLEDTRILPPRQWPFPVHTWHIIYIWCIVVQGHGSKQLPTEGATNLPKLKILEMFVFPQLLDGSMDWNMPVNLDSLRVVVAITYSRCCFMANSRILILDVLCTHLIPFVASFILSNFCARILSTFQPGLLEEDVTVTQVVYVTTMYLAIRDGLVFTFPVMKFTNPPVFFSNTRATVFWQKKSV